MQTETTKQDTASLAPTGNHMGDGTGIVRPLAPQDFEAIIPMLGRCLSSSPVGLAITIDRESAGHVLDRIASGQGAFGYVAEDAEGLCGFILALEVPCLWDINTKTAHVVAWWVEPRARDTTADSQLLQAAEDTAKKRGASVILCGGEPWGVDVELSQRMLMAHSYDTVEPQRFKVLDKGRAAHPLS